MKKAMLIILLVLLHISITGAQELIDIYKTGKIAIHPDSDFGADNSYFENNDQSLKRYTNIVLSDDEDIFLLDRKEHQVLKFDKSGRFLKKINLNTTKSSSVYHRVNELQILDNKYLLISGGAFIKVFDLNGKFIKTIDFDYPIYNPVALKNNRVGIEGFVLLKNRKTKMHIAVVDIQTEKEKPVIAFFRDFKKEHISFKTEKSGWLGSSFPQRASKVILNRSLDGNLIVGNSKNSEILIYDTDGKQLNKIKLTYSPQKVKQEDKDKVYQSFEKFIKKHNAPDSLLQLLKSPDFYYQYMPYYYGIKIDSDDNILVFKYTEDKNHVFRVYQVYSKEGKFICETTLEPGEFDNPSLRLLTFSKDNLYALLKLKDDVNGIRLVKAKLQSAL